MGLKLKPEVKDLWITALRSGRYAQGRGKLSTPTGYCCLGLLCELAIEEGVDLKKEVETVSYYDFTAGRDVQDVVVQYDGSLNYLPVSVIRWAFAATPEDLHEAEVWGTNDNPKVKDPASDSRVTLAELNDGGFTFDDIADLIEEQL